MAYFNYHAKAQNLIKTGHCVGAELVDKRKDICPALVLYFDNNLPMPVREHMFCIYFELLKRYNITVDDLRSQSL